MRAGGAQGESSLDSLGGPAEYEGPSIGSSPAPLAGAAAPAENGHLAEGEGLGGRRSSQEGEAESAWRAGSGEGAATAEAAGRFGLLAYEEEADAGDGEWGLMALLGGPFFPFVSRAAGERELLAES